jgi:hypothetical protein
MEPSSAQSTSVLPAGGSSAAPLAITRVPMMFIKQMFKDMNRDVLTEDQTEIILAKHLDGDFCVFPMADTKTTISQIKDIGRRFRVRYPNEFIAHVCGKFPGIYIEVKEEFWPRPKLYDVGPFWSFLYAIYTFTSAPESEDWMRLDSAAESFQKDTGLRAAPILKVVGDADIFCVDSEGRLVQFNHETNELTLVPLNFWQLLDQEIADLRARKDRKRSGS